MRRRCRNCLCRSCFISCCGLNGCNGKKKKCRRYSGFRQLSIFDTPPKPKYQKAPRHSWEYYGITKKRYNELTDMIRSGRYAALASSAAHAACESLSEYILLTVIKNVSYDTLQKKWELGEIEQIPYCRTDFYGYRRYFMHLFNEKVKEIENV